MAKVHQSISFSWKKWAKISDKGVKAMITLIRHSLHCYLVMRADDGYAVVISVDVFLIVYDLLRLMAASQSYSAQAFYGRNYLKMEMSLKRKFRLFMYDEKDAVLREISFCCGDEIFESPVRLVECSHSCTISYVSTVNPEPKPS